MLASLDSVSLTSLRDFFLISSRRSKDAATVTQLVSFSLFARRDATRIMEILGVREQLLRSLFQERHKEGERQWRDKESENRQAAQPSQGIKWGIKGQ